MHVVAYMPIMLATCITGLVCSGAHAVDQRKARHAGHAHV
jgi:hypothetical protein